LGGARRDIEQILPCLDLFVSSSLWEGFPTVIMESMAAGIPIVATDIPGSRDLIRDRQNGWTAPPADAQALARAIRAALEDEPSRREFSERNRQQAGQFAIEAVSTEYEKVYATLSERR
jgi:glycosyltransferase involved in cell wall biosynthesis